MRHDGIAWRITVVVVVVVVVILAVVFVIVTTVIAVVSLVVVATVATVATVVVVVVVVSLVAVAIVAIIAVVAVVAIVVIAVVSLVVVVVAAAAVIVIAVVSLVVVAVVVVVIVVIVVVVVAVVTARRPLPFRASAAHSAVSAASPHSGWSCVALLSSPAENQHIFCVTKCRKKNKDIERAMFPLLMSTNWGYSKQWKAIAILAKGKKNLFSQFQLALANLAKRKYTV